MPSRLAARLHAARDHLFVGRTAELTLLRAALEADVLPFYVLYVFGPAGVGKTSLLRAFERLCRTLDVAPHYLDARDVEPVPALFMAALRRTLGLADDANPLTALADPDKRHVLLIDTFETIAALDGWLRERVLPDLTDNVLIVLAGREMPDQAWRTDPGWQSLVHLLPLRNLDAEDCRTYLRRRDVPENQHAEVLTFTHGHPLATSLVADLLDQAHSVPFRPQEAPSVIQALLEQFVQRVPGPAHRATLEAGALVRFVTEDLLQTMLATNDAYDLFKWLGSLSFVEPDARGLSLHDLTRDVLVADLRWRNSEWYAELHRRARWYYTERLKQAGTVFDQAILSDYTFLHRDHPLIRPLVTQLRSQWQASEPILPEKAQAADWPGLLAMVTRYEGEASAALARHWFERQPDNILVYRSRAGQPLGFQLALSLNRASHDDRLADPATYRAWQYLEQNAPLRKGEHATLFRFWMAHDTYQDISPVQSLITIDHVRHYLNTPGLAFTFLTCRHPALWEPIYTFAAMKRLREADFEVGETTYAVFGHDWRTMPPTLWLDLLAQYSSFGGDEEPSAMPKDPMIVLSRSGFEEAVRDAFREYARPEKLRGNPLLRSRLVIDRVGLDADEAESIEALRLLLEEGANTLQSSPREARYYQALRRTYLQPAPSQEKAAEMLDLPISTFRRYLKRGLEHVTGLLWQQETGTL